MSSTAFKTLLGALGASGGGGGGGGGAAAAGGGGIIGGIGALIRSLPGGTSGSIGAVPAVVGVPAGILAASALPFLAQILGGVVPAAGGGLLAAMGIAGALGAGATPPNKVAEANKALAAANARVAADQARLAQVMGGTAGTPGRPGHPASAASIASAHASLIGEQARVVADQVRLSALTAAGSKASASQIASAHASLVGAQARVIADQARVAGLAAGTPGTPGRPGHAATPAQIAAAQAALTSAQSTQAKARDKAQQANENKMTAAQADIRAQLANLGSDALVALQQVGLSFAPVLQSMISHADILVQKMTPVFSKAVSTIAGPFKVFGDTIIKTLGSPQVASSIQAVANAFGKVMTAFTPDIPGIINSFADAIERIANAVAKNPKAYADFLNFFFQVGIMVLNGIAFLTDFANYVEQHFLPAVKHFADFWGEVWKAIWQNTIGLAYGGTSHLQRIISGWLHNLAHYFDVFRHGIAAQWDLFWSDTIGRAINGQRRLEALISSMLHTIAHYFDVFRHDVASIFANSINWLYDAGKNIILGLFNGIKNAMSSIDNWIKSNVVNPLIHAVKHFFGISSPASIMVPVGASLIQGVFKGMFSSAKDLGKFMGKVFGGWPEALAHMIGKSFIDVAHLPAKALHALGSVAGKVGGFVASLFKGGPVGAGVERWLNIAKIALMLNNLPDSMAGQVLFQMRTESGGNPNAINLWDINAQRGDPSRGLMQVIGSTFAAYHVPGTSNNIYDPLANIAAAINYAKHVYGPGLMRGGMGLGSGHGYDQGGWLPPGASVAYNLTGRPELVLNHEQLSALSRGGDGSTQYIAHFDSLTGAAIEAHVRTAFQAMSLTQGNLNRQGRRS